MKNRVMTLVLISALVLSSVSLVLSLASNLTPEAQRPGAIPPEAFADLGGKKGVGFGDWVVTPLSSYLSIYSYPAGAVLNKSVTVYIGYGGYVYYVYTPLTWPGWDGYLVDMLTTITVTMDTADATRQVDVTFNYLKWFWNSTVMPNYPGPGSNTVVAFNDCIKETTTMRIGIGSGSPQSVTFSGQIYLVTLTLVGTSGSAGGHYFVSSDRRV